MAGLATLLTQLEEAAAQVKAAAARLDTVRTTTNDTIATAQAEAQRLTLAAQATLQNEEATFTAAVQSLDALKAEFRRDFAAVLGSSLGSSGRVRQ